ncbi:MAG: glucose dehydrogenase [Anaerolineaceae bacterium]|nr:glucose dehydrogenase [Anaerolineaceae bacterium]
MFRPIFCLIVGMVSAILITITGSRLAAGDSPYELQPIADGLTFPTAIVQPPQENDRLFIADLAGTIWIWKQGSLQPTPFLDLSKSISPSANGAGLHNLVFHPDYQQNGFFYVVYTLPDRDEILVRYQVRKDNPDIADPDSAFIVMKIQHLTEFHYGGQLAFGPDGDLYWSMGDGAYKKSPAQNWHSYLGSILRLDVDHGEPYSIPAGNATIVDPTAKPEIWAKGLRNPWRFSFDSLTGDLYVPDVGEASVEEINVLPANSNGGTNFGWSLFEGTTPFKGTDKTGLTFPVVIYGHDDGNCSIIGGYVYRGSALSALAGKYIFGDYCSGWLWSTYQKTPNRWYTAQLMLTNQHITTFGQDNAGEIYVGAVGRAYKLVAAN